jgi:DNA-binding protein YbaB
MSTVLHDEKSSDGLVNITVTTVDRQIKTIDIADELLEDKEQLEDYLILNLNKALNRAAEYL